MTLHQDHQLFRESFEAAAQRLRLRPVFVEKDYWVTYVLRNLSLWTTPLCKALGSGNVSRILHSLPTSKQ